MSSDESGMKDAEAAQFCGYMSRHLVVLTGEYESYDDGKLFKRGVFAISGFILRLHERYFWVTAGHCLTQLDVALANGALKVFDVGWADYFGMNAAHVHKIPFEYEAGCGFHVDDGEAGLDFGLIPLDYLTIQNLIKNDIKEVSRVNWEHQHALTFSHYFLLGTPSHLVRETAFPHGEIAAAIQPVMVALKRLDPDEVDDPPPEDWFVGRIHEAVDIESIAGMSGGPIYGFRTLPDGRLVYHVVALQSRWRPKTRVVMGCSMPYFAEMLHQSMIQANEELSATSDPM